MISIAKYWMINKTVRFISFLVLSHIQKSEDVDDENQGIIYFSQVKFTTLEKLNISIVSACIFANL
jgi:hypothetical protein